MKAKIIKTGNISKFDKDFPYNGWPTVISLENGDLLCGYSGFRAAHVCPFGKVVISRSTDGGYTWSEPNIVIDTPLDDRDAGLLEVDGAIYLNSFTNSRKVQQVYHKWHNHTPELIARTDAYLETITDEIEQKYLGSLLSKSTDGGKTFCDPVLIPVTNPHGLIKLKDGSMLLVGTGFGDPENASFEYLPDRKGIFSMKVNPDLTFEKPILVVPPTPQGANLKIANYFEPHAIDLGDKILMGIRIADLENENALTIHHAYSTDGGKTFSTPVPTGFEGAPPHYYKDDKGRVVLSYSRRKAPYPTVVRFSLDNGETFGDEVVVCENGLNADLGYASTTQNANGEYITIHYQTDENNEKHKAIKYTVWKLEE